MEGYIKLHRRSLDSEVFEDATLWKVFSWALLSAEWRDGEKLPPGSFRIKVRDAADDLKMPATTLYRSLRRLVDLGCLILSSGAGRGGKTVVSVCSWTTYQPSAKSEKARNIYGTKAEHLWNKSGTKKRAQAEQKTAPLTQGDNDTYDDGTEDNGTFLEQKRNIVLESAEHSFSEGGTAIYKEEEYKEEEGLRRRRKKSSPIPDSLSPAPFSVFMPEGELTFASARQHEGQPLCFKVAETKIAEWQATYPAIDVKSELRRAAQWLRDNPQRRKTPGGMLKFLFQWLGRAVDHAPSKNTAPNRLGSSRTQRTVDAARKYLDGFGGS